MVYPTLDHRILTIILVKPNIFQELQWTLQVGCGGWVARVKALALQAVARVREAMFQASRRFNTLNLRSPKS